MHCGHKLRCPCWIIMDVPKIPSRTLTSWTCPAPWSTPAASLCSLCLHRQSSASKYWLPVLRPLCLQGHRSGSARFHSPDFALPSMRPSDTQNFDPAAQGSCQRSGVCYRVLRDCLPTSWPSTDSISGKKKACLFLTSVLLDCLIPQSYKQNMIFCNSNF